MLLPCESMTVSKFCVGAEGFGSGSVVMAVGCCAGAEKGRSEVQARSRVSVVSLRVGISSKYRAEFG